MAPKDFQTTSSVKRRKIVTSSWQRLGLARFLKGIARPPVWDSKTIFLANPAESPARDLSGILKFEVPLGNMKAG
jgi:hypothetical protein